MMYLYLVQHGVALSKEENPERPLSEKGRSEVSKVAQAISSISVGQIFHSGKNRAQETAVLIGAAVGREPLENDGLAPMDDPSLWAERLENEEKNTMLVGHLPHMGRLASLILCGDPEAEVVEFRMGGVVCLARIDGKWSLQWMIVPELF